VLAETLSAVALLVGLTAALRHRARRAGERAWRIAHPVAADGIIPGAGPISLDGAARAVLLVHGFGDTPQTLALQAMALHAHGWTVRVPLLPGHGRTLEAFSVARAWEWTETVSDGFDALCKTHERVAIVGLSMGGALATSLAAAAGPRAAALVLLAPFLEVSPRARLGTSLWPLWSFWRAWVCGDATESIRDPVARRESLGYGCSSPRALRELRRVVDAAALDAGQLRLPTLVVHSRSDYRIPEAAAERGFSRLGTPVKELRWVERSGHVITVDFDATLVTQTIVDWLEQHVPRSLPAKEVREGEGERERP